MLGYKESLNYQYLRKQILDLNSDAQEEKELKSSQQGGKKDFD